MIAFFDKARHGLNPKKQPTINPLIKNSLPSRWRSLWAVRRGSPEPEMRRQTRWSASASPLDVEYVCADHYGYVAGEEAMSFIRQTIEAAKQEHALMEEAYRKTGNIEIAAKELTAGYFRKYPDWVVSPEIVEGVYRQMLRHIASTKTLPSRATSKSN